MLFDLLSILDMDEEVEEFMLRESILVSPEGFGDDNDDDDDVGIVEDVDDWEWLLLWIADLSKAGEGEGMMGYLDKEEAFAKWEK